MNNDEITKLNDHMAHVLGRINHLELQAKFLVAQLAKLQARVSKIQEGKPGSTGGDGENDDYWAQK